MADQNDNKDDLVGLPDFPLATITPTPLPEGFMAELAAIHDSFEDGVGKTFHFDAGPVEYAMKPGAYIEAKGGTSYLDAIRAMPGVVIFEDGERIDGVTDHIETAREHNERKYSDLMRRIDALANRPRADD